MKKTIFILIVCLLFLGSFSTVMAQMSVGQRYYFGNYEQGSGKEQIPWFVIKINGNKALLLSEKVLDEKAYHDEYVDSVTWETCSLRKWLNNDFYNTAFSSSEKSRIVEVINTNPAVSGSVQGFPFYTEGGRDTRDKVFLLSIDEAEDFYRIFGAWRPIFSVYVGKLGGYGADVNIGPVWWLRSPGAATNCASMVAAEGIIKNCFEPAWVSTIGVRPAIWINF